MQIGENDSFWAHWTNIEWLIAAVWTAGLLVAGWVWRLSLKVAMLEHTLEEREEHIERRHVENLRSNERLQGQIASLTSRLDRLMERLR